MEEFVHSLLKSLAKAKPGHVDREEVVAHSTLTGLAQHWPDHPLLQELAILETLQTTQFIREAEPGRWIKQRRIGLAKLAKLAQSEIQ
jgi:hypothetical protein